MTATPEKKALSPEAMDFALLLLDEFKAESSRQQRALLDDYEKRLDAKLDAKLDEKLGEIREQIKKLERNMGEIVHEQRAQKRILQKHEERFARGDEEFERLRDEIKRNNDLTMIALERQSPAAANTVTVTNKPGVESHQESSFGQHVTQKLIPAAIGGGISLAIYKMLTGG